jgi:hypothetical protein
MSAPLTRLGGAVALGLLLAACSRGTLPVAPNGGGLAPGVSSGKPVTFTVNVDAKAFSDKRQITVTVWDSEQLAIADATSGCSVGYDARTGKETTTCPPGVTYRKPTPEETMVSRDDLAKGLTITSRTVTTGERYRVSVGGMAADDCNSAGGSQEGVAGSETLKVAITEIASTAMACVPSRGQ